MRPYRTRATEARPRIYIRGGSSAHPRPRASASAGGTSGFLGLAGAL